MSFSACVLFQNPASFCAGNIFRVVLMAITEISYTVTLKLNIKYILSKIFAKVTGPLHILSSYPFAYINGSEPPLPIKN